MGKIHQLHTAVAGSYGMFLFGLLYVWPSYTASLFTAKNTTLLSAPMTQVDISLIGSLPSLGAMMGTLLAGRIVNLLGRHKGGLILILPMLVSWTIVSLTNSSTVIMIARFIGGFTGGASLVYGPVFISEVAEESIRGLLASGPILLYSLGALMSYLFGWFLTYRYIIWINMVISCVGLIIVMMVTESPVWLLRQKKEAAACLSFAHYRGLSPESKVVLEEMSRMRAQIIPIVEMISINDNNALTNEAEKEKLKTDEEVTKKRETAFKMICISPSTRRAFIVTGLTLTTQIMTGLLAVLVYAKDIFTNAVPSMSPHLCSALLAATLLIGAISSAVFNDKFGRRILLVVSCVVVTLCLILMGVNLQTNILPSWVTAILILVYCFASKLGAGNIPYVLLAEVFLPEVHSLVAMILIECVWLVSFIHLAIFPFMVKHLGVHGSFYCFSIFGTLDGLVATFLLPETKGLTNEQIQAAFLRKRRN